VDVQYPREADYAVAEKQNKKWKRIEKDKSGVTVTVPCAWTRWPTWTAPNLGCNHHFTPLSPTQERVSEYQGQGCNYGDGFEPRLI
jgi:hypothetical protein